MQYVPAKPEPPPIKGAKFDPPTKSTKTTQFEVLNPKGVEVASGSTTKGIDPGETEAMDLDEDDDSSLPQMTPTLVAFSKLPLRSYEQSFHYIQEHRDTYVPGASDALLVAAFEAEKRAERGYAKQCVHQSLLLQYCEKLGRDGVRVFFKRYFTLNTIDNCAVELIHSSI